MGKMMSLVEARRRCPDLVVVNGEASVESVGLVVWWGCFRSRCVCLVGSLGLLWREGRLDRSFIYTNTTNQAHPPKNKPPKPKHNQ